MQEHEKSLLVIVLIGAFIGFSKLLVSDEKLTLRLVIGRTILGSASSTIAGLVLIQMPGMHPNALIAIASALGILGSNFIESYIRNNVDKWGGK